MARMRAGSTTDDYRNALSGEGEFGSLGYEWSDKPHRLVYDLCGEIEHLRSLIREVTTTSLLRTRRCAVDKSLRISDRMLEIAVIELNWLLPNYEFSNDEKKRAILSILGSMFDCEVIVTEDAEPKENPSFDHP